MSLFIVLPLTMGLFCLIFRPSTTPQRLEVRPAASRVSQLAPGWRASYGAAVQRVKILPALLRPHKLSLSRLRRRSASTQHLMDWIHGPALLEHAAPADVSAFTAWIAGLSDQQLDQFIAKMTQFCAGMGYQITWLFDGRADMVPRVKRSLMEAVTHYSLAYWQAQQVVQDVQALHTFQNWQAAPQRRANQELSCVLYTLLVERGMVSISTEQMLAKDRQRSALIQQSICQTAQAHPDQFHAILRDALAPACISSTELPGDEVPTVNVA